MPPTFLLLHAYFPSTSHPLHTHFTTTYLLLTSYVPPTSYLLPSYFTPTSHLLHTYFTPTYLLLTSYLPPTYLLLHTYFPPTSHPLHTYFTPTSLLLTSYLPPTYLLLHTYFSPTSHLLLSHLTPTSLHPYFSSTSSRSSFFATLFPVRQFFGLGRSSLFTIIFQYVSSKFFVLIETLDIIYLKTIERVFKEYIQ